jgi:hypothetical protein
MRTRDWEQLLLTSHLLAASDLIHEQSVRYISEHGSTKGFDVSTSDPEMSRYIEALDVALEPYYAKDHKSPERGCPLTDTAPS